MYKQNNDYCSYEKPKHRQIGFDLERQLTDTLYTVILVHVYWPLDLVSLVSLTGSSSSFSSAGAAPGPFNFFANSEAKSKGAELGFWNQRNYQLLFTTSNVGV